VLTRFWRQWRAERARRARAASYIRALQREPSDEDVAWLAAHGTSGDEDHARWELRYARRALGLITAQRDALDDRTASLVARELTASLARDPNVAAARLPIAERQINARLRAYADALTSRDAPRSARERLGETLMGFAGRAGGVAGVASGADDAHAGDILTRYLSEANEALRREFGAAALPDDVAPSVLFAARPR
jgi:hypothetical protein